MQDCGLKKSAMSIRMTMKPTTPNMPAHTFLFEQPLTSVYKGYKAASDLLTEDLEQAEHPLES